MHVHATSHPRLLGARNLLLLAVLALALWLLAWSAPSTAPAAVERENVEPLAPAPRPGPLPVARPAPRMPAAASAPVVGHEAVASTAEARTRDEAQPRPDARSAEDETMRAQERAVLIERLERQEPNPQAESGLRAALTDKLLARGLPSDALGVLRCSRTLCRFELNSRGQSSLAPAAEARELIATARDLGETWVLANEAQPGLWSVEGFAPTEHHTLTGPGIE